MDESPKGKGSKGKGPKGKGPKGKSICLEGSKNELKTKNMRAEIPDPLVCLTFSHDRFLMGKHQKYWNQLVQYFMKNSSF